MNHLSADTDFTDAELHLSTDNNDDEEIDGDECSLCNQGKRDLIILPCEHCFCDKCRRQIIKQPARRPDDEVANDVVCEDLYPCPVCQKETAMNGGASSSDFPFKCSSITERPPAIPTRYQPRGTAAAHATSSPQQTSCGLGQRALSSSQLALRPTQVPVTRPAPVAVARPAPVAVARPAPVSHAKQDYSVSGRVIYDESDTARARKISIRELVPRRKKTVKFLSGGDSGAYKDDRVLIGSETQQVVVHHGPKILAEGLTTPGAFPSPQVAPDNAAVTFNVLAGLCQDCGCLSCKYTCLSCLKLVCQFCRAAHGSSSHRLLLLPCCDEQGSEDDIYCSAHELQPLMGYCTRCQAPLCHMCLPTHDSSQQPRAKVIAFLGQKLGTRFGQNVGGQQGGHEVTTLEQAAHKARKALTEAVDNVHESLRRLGEARHNLNKQQESLGEKTATLAESIRQRASEAKRMIDVIAADATVLLQDCKKNLNTKLVSDIASLKTTTDESSLILKWLNLALESRSEIQTIRNYNRSMEIIEKGASVYKNTESLSDSGLEIALRQQSLGPLFRTATSSIGKPELTKVHSNTS